MTWNYRVVKCVDDGGLESFQIHEAYYTVDDKVGAITENGVGPFGETPEELREDLEKMQEAFNKPVLDGNALRTTK